MQRAVTVKGTLNDPRHIELDEPIADIEGQVEVTVRAVGSEGTSRQRAAKAARLMRESHSRMFSDSAELIREDRDR